MNRSLSLLLGVALLIVGISLPCYADTIVFSDNFNDGNANGWIYASRDGRQLDPTSGWSVVDGRLLENSGWDAQFALVNNLSLSSQTLQVQADILGSSGWGGITLWYKDLNNFIDIGSYANGAAIYVGEYVNGIAYSSTYTNTSGELPLSGFKAVANSSTGKIDFYVGGVYVFTYTAQTYSRTGLSGVLAGNNGAYFDNFMVTSNTCPAPVPEPGTMLLLGSGLAGLVGYGRRRLKK